MAERLPNNPVLRMSRLLRGVWMRKWPGEYVFVTRVNDDLKSVTAYACDESGAALPGAALMHLPLNRHGESPRGYTAYKVPGTPLRDRKKV